MIYILYVIIVVSSCVDALGFLSFFCLFHLFASCVSCPKIMMQGIRFECKIVACCGFPMPPIHQTVTSF